MGDYLLLQWLATRRGLAVFILLVLITVFSNLCSFSKRGLTKSANPPADVKTSQRR
jgi:hypothetical protein